MHRSSLVLALAAAAALAGCDWSQKIEARIVPDALSLADRCGMIMRAAMPFADLDLGERTAQSPDIRTIVAHVAATRSDIAPGAAGDRDLAAECTFTDNVMTGFRWVKGGPTPPAAAPSETPPPPAAPEQKR